MESRSHALIAGVFLVLLGSAVAFALWWLGQGGVAMNRYLIETLNNVTGLNVQAQVRYRGIRAGKVEAIEPDPADPRRILVTVALESRFRLTQGSRARLGYQGLTGLAYVQIEDDGNNPEPLGAPPGQLPRLPMADGAAEGLVGRATQAMEQMSRVADRLAVVLDQRNVDNVARTLDNLARGSEGLRELPAVLAQLHEFVSAENIARWQRILAHAENTLGAAAPLTEDVRQLVATLNATTRRADQLIQGLDAIGTQAQASTLPQLEQTLRELRATSRQLGRVLEDVEREPRMLLFGNGAAEPGPGESGFVFPAPTR